MTPVIEVRFKGNRREYFTWPSEDSSSLRLETPVIVEVERGQDFGVVSALGGIAEKKCQRCGACGEGGGAEAGAAPRAIVRVATADDRKTAADLRVNEEDVRRAVRDRVRQHMLPMKVSDAEWQWDRRKLTIYFTAEQRVDFRALVRDLAGLFRARIELRQIGARDEAKRLDGIGRCGRQLCIASWLPEGKPVSLSLAKAQGLSLNPVQISGPCGRLLCCLHYEHDFYVQQRKRFPKEGKTVKTSEGNERVVAVDIFRERVTLRSDAGATRVVALDQLQQQ
ncbi:MAG TPA: regulatory iron-sulfur-containing complex subunit RicT [Gemmatimonadales bacterium]|nr:regulatory iron-sulfur-containing complex subunit RicT [Gemmatimonadales bacterium]